MAHTYHIVTEAELAELSAEIDAITAQDAKLDASNGYHAALLDANAARLDEIVALLEWSYRETRKRELGLQLVKGGM